MSILVLILISHGCKRLFSNDQRHQAVRLLSMRDLERLPQVLKPLQIMSTVISRLLDSLMHCLQMTWTKRADNSLQSPALADFENQVFHNMETFTGTLNDDNIRVVLVYTRRQLRLSETDDNLKREGDIHGITAVVIELLPSSILSPF